MAHKMEWTQFIIFFLGVFGLFIWNRTESRADIRHMDNKLDAIRNLTDAIRIETKETILSTRETVMAIQLEMKDFHNRLCAIEERRKS